jgi:hypothetical protein
MIHLLHRPESRNLVYVRRCDLVAHTGLFEQHQLAGQEVELGVSWAWLKWPVPRGGRGLSHRSCDKRGVYCRRPVILVLVECPQVYILAGY